MKIIPPIFAEKRLKVHFWHAKIKKPVRRPLKIKLMGRFVHDFDEIGGAQIFGLKMNYNTYDSWPIF